MVLQPFSSQEQILKHRNLRSQAMSRLWMNGKSRKEVKHVTTNQIEYLKSEETERHNREMEKYNLQNLGELTRHNRSVEEETRRHNFGDEAVRQQSNAINYFSANNAKEHMERSDAETNRANIAGETEMNRSHLANESIGRTQAYASILNAQAANRQAAASEARVPIEAKRAAAEYSQAETAARKQETYQSEVSSGNLFRDAQRISTIKSIMPNIENTKSQTDLNRSREVESHIKGIQEKYNMAVAPIDKITNLQNQLGSGVGYPLGRMFYGQANQTRQNNGTGRSYTQQREERKAQQQAWNLSEFDRILQESGEH